MSLQETSRHPLVEKILSGGAPEPVCVAAARGALPVPAEDLLRARVWLAMHGAATVATACREALAQQPGVEMAAHLAAASWPAEMLDLLAGLRGDDETVLEAVVLHPSVGNDTLVALAASAPPAVLERLTDNQQRLLDCEPLVRALDANPALPAAARLRLRDVLAELQRRRRTRPPAAPPDEPVVPPVEATDGVPADPAGEPAAETGAPAAETGAPAAPEAAEPPPSEGEIESSGPEPDTYARIMDMTLPQRIKLAMLGNREERAILIRDNAKSVALAVLKSPKIRQAEIESFAGQRSLCEDVIRTIAESREWTKSYAVIHALCKNPRTPPRKAITFLARLNNRDLKLMGSDRGVPEVVRTTARRFYVTRTQRTIKRPGKK